MRLIVLDAETFWSATHSLTKMTPIEYVRHEDTELQTLAVRVDGAPAFVLVGEQAMRDWVARTDFSDALVVGHNLSGFDSMLCAWRLGIRPKMWGCTLAMARELGLARTVGGSLKALAAHFGLHAKGDIEATNTKGRRLAEFSKAELHALVEYNKLDADIGLELFKRLAKGFPARSMRLIDVTIRMLVEPRFRVDRSLIKITLKQITEAKQRALLEIGRELAADEPALFALSDDEIVEHTRQQLASAPKFAAVLESLGVPVPMKASPSDPSKMIPALAKTDEAMTSLLEHDDVRVATAASARLQVKSVQLETRLQRFLDIADVMGGLMPIALNYYGAENTGRWSGCLTGDTRVIVMEPNGAVVEKQIVDVLLDDLVWDGVEFVSHEGVVFSGYAEVIEHDGVRGTADHVVFTEVGEISLEEAMQGSHSICPAGSPQGHQMDPHRGHVEDY